MADFIYKPLDETDVDIASDPDSVVAPILGIKKSLFMQQGSETVITEGPLVDGVKEILEEIRDYVESDGGHIEFVDITNGWVRLSFQGACGSCGVSASTLLYIEEEVCTRMPTIKGVETIQE